jgi:arylsulfatase A-like enzyme
LTDPPRPTAPATFAAGLALALLGGAAGGLADAGIALLQREGSGAQLFVVTTSLGAALALTAATPVVLAMFVLRRPLRAAAKLAVVAVLLAVAPLAVVVGRRLYHRIPWDAVEWALVLAACAAVTALCTLAAKVGDRVARSRETAAVRSLSRALLPSLLLAVPAAARVVPALGPPHVERRGSDSAANLLLLTVDTLRPDRLGCTGSASARTPWMDRITRRGVLFSDCNAASPWTLPSLATVLTGTYPGEHRVLEEISGVSDSVSTLAERCRASGMRTAAFVSNAWLGPGGLARGFDSFDVAERLECLAPSRPTRTYRRLIKVALRVGRLDAGERISRLGISWIERGEGAWFLWLHYFDPHLPNWPSPPFDRLFGPPPSRVGSSLAVEEIREWPASGDDARRSEVERLYDGEVVVADRAIGMVVRALDRAGALDRTVIVLAGDHGEELWDHGGYGHGHAMHDEVVRVPFAVRPAGGSPGRVEGGLVSLVDLAATALRAAGIRCDGGAPRGRDLLAERAADPATPYAAYGEAVLYGEEQKFLRTGPWKVVWSPPAEVPRVFDVTRDPGERNDLAAAEPALADSLLGSLRTWAWTVGSSVGLQAGALPETLDPATEEQLRALGYIR